MLNEEIQLPLKRFKRFGFLLFPVSAELRTSEYYDIGGPSFIGAIQNVTVKAGRDAILNCAVKNLGEYKVRTMFPIELKVNKLIIDSYLTDQRRVHT